MSDRQLRPMLESDLPAVVAIEQQVEANPWNAAMFAEELRLGSPALVALAGEKVLGYALARDQVAFWDLLLLGVAPEQQRQGWGRLLLGALLRQAAARGVAHMVLEVRVSNLPAICLYESLGFVAQGRRKGYYQKPLLEDALIMVRELSPEGAVLINLSVV